MTAKPPNPFKGLVSFDREDALFGRDRDMVLFRDRVQTGRTTLLFAGSGVGKTSFLEAKAVPDLELAGFWVCLCRSWATSEPLAALDVHVGEKLFDLGEPLRNRLATLLSGDLDASDRAILTAAHERLLAPSPSLHEKVVNLLAPACEDLPRVRTPGDDLALPVGLVLVLDQFEEIFQYHAYREHFEAFLEQLCKIVNDRSVEVRVVLSLREEYLGELSIFDNRIPDPFANYYRLRCPTLQEAYRIVENTCRESGVSPDAAGLTSLIRELATIEVGAGSSAERPTNAGGKGAEAIVRNFVPPPYLQLVCQVLWDETTFEAGPGTGATGFLAGYKAGSATQVLDAYCRRKLGPLTIWQKRWAARAFDYLVTQNGAKMAYELSQLARHMSVPEKWLAGTLERLSAPDTRILRRTPSPGGVPWFELYHDMYGRIVRKWRLDFNRGYEMARIAIVFVLVLFISIGIGNISEERRAEQVALELRKKSDVNDQSILQQTDLNDPNDFSKAQQAYARLKQRGTTSSEPLWGEAWARRASTSEALGETTEALLYGLKALSIDATEEKEHRYRRSAYRVAEPFRDLLLATFGHAGLDGLVPTINGGPLAEGEPGLVTWSGRDVRLWSLSKPDRPLHGWTVPMPASSRSPASGGKTDSAVRSRNLTIHRAYVHPQVSLIVAGDDGETPFGWIASPAPVQATEHPSEPPGASKSDGQYVSLVPPTKSGWVTELQVTADERFPFGVVVDDGSTVTLFRRSLAPDKPGGRMAEGAWTKVGTAPYGEEGKYKVSSSGRRIAIKRGDRPTVTLFSCDEPAPPGGKKARCTTDAGPQLKVRSEILRMAFGPDGESLAFQTVDQKIHVFDLPSRSESWSVDLSTQGRSPLSFQLGPGAKFLATTAVAGVYLWSPEGTLSRRLGVVGALDASGHQVLSVERGLGARAWSADGADAPIAAWGRGGSLSANGEVWVESVPDKKIVVMNAADRTKKREIDLTTLPVKIAEKPIMSVWPDGKGERIAATFNTSDSFLTFVWNAAPDESPWQPVGEKGQPVGVMMSAMAASGKYLAGSSTEGFGLWRLSDKTLVMQSTGPEVSGPRRVEFSPDGSLVGSIGYDSSLRVWETEGGSGITVPNPIRRVKDMALGRGSMMVTTADSTFLWKISKEPNLAQVSIRPPSEVSAFALDPSGSYAALATKDNRLLLWSAGSNPIQHDELRTDSGAPRRVAFTEDGKTILLTAGSRVHRVQITDQSKLRFAGSRFVRGNPADLRPLDPAAERVRVVSLLENAKVVQELSFGDAASDPELHARDPGQDARGNLLPEWERLLGLALDERGVVTPKVK